MYLLQRHVTNVSTYIIKVSIFYENSIQKLITGLFSNDSDTNVIFHGNWIETRYLHF